MTNKISETATKPVICVTWYSCYVSAALPIAVIFRTEEHNNQVFCTIRFPNPTTTFRRVYEVFLVVVFIILPIAVQIWAYFFMSKVVSVDVFPHFRIRSREIQRNPNLNLKGFSRGETAKTNVRERPAIWLELNEKVILLKCLLHL